jgi:hypothetical protein
MARIASGIALTASLLLAACGGGGGGADGHGHHESHIDTAGRIVMAEAGQPKAYVFDLDSGSTIAGLDLLHPATALYASPGKRYALAFQRLNDSVQIIDGGIWQEPHDDHFDDYKEAPQLRQWRLTERRPTHYQAHGAQAALFNDGSGDPLVPASVQVLTDASIGASKVEQQLALPMPMHGAAEPLGNYLLTTYRAPDAASTLPSQVELYRRTAAGYEFVRRFDPSCPGLHGSASNERHSVFGCTDGVLVVTRTGDAFDAEKIANPAALPDGARIGTVAGHADRDTFVAIASPGHLFEIDPKAKTISPIEWAQGRTRRAHGFDAHGENFLVLDDTGTLHILDAEDGWNKRASLAAIQTMPAESPFPAIAFSRAADKAFLSDPVGKALVEIDLKTAAVGKRHALGITPSALVWVGIPRHEH